jgi:hypothetical protein
MPNEMLCPFFTLTSGGVGVVAEKCAGNHCALWVERASRDKRQGACSFRVMAARLSAIEERLNTIASKTK